MIPSPEPRPIAVRAYAEPTGGIQSPPRRDGTEPPPPSGWALVFDTETTADAAQQLRIGAYQVRQAGELREAGLFYDPLCLADAERSTLYGYASDHGFAVRTVEEFVEEVFFPYAYDLGGLCVGLNLPFDLARLAIHHAPARGSMRGGFSFRLSEDDRRPRVQVKHLTGRAALIQFAKPRGQDTPRGMRRRGLRVPAQRGHVADVRTLAGALLGGSWTLKALADHLRTAHRKQDADEHGGMLTDEYLDYATNDVQVTWECFERLRDRYDGYGLTRTPLTRIYSEASLGKACLREMGVRPWRELQPDFPPELLGSILSTYYGGRAEVRLRRVAVEHIGKEANRWEEQLYLGEDPEAQIVYGTTPEDRERLRGTLLRAGRRFGQRALAEVAGVSAREVGAILRGERQPTQATRMKLARAIPRLEAAKRQRAEHERAVLQGVRARSRGLSVRRFAAMAGVHYPHLTEVLSGRRRPSRAMLAKLEAALVAQPLSSM